MRYTTAFDQSVARHPERVAVETLGGDRYTYADFDERTTALANALTERVGEARTASLLDNGLPALDVIIAATKRGVANVPLNTRSSPSELSFMAENGEARLVIVDESNREAASEMLGGADVERVLFVGEDPGPLDSLGIEVESYDAAVDGADGSAPSNAPAGDEAAIFYTSGTTGKPKGVPVDVEQCWYSSVQIMTDWHLPATSRSLVISPLYHVVTAVSWAMPTLQVGATAIPMAEFDPVEVLRTIEDRDITHFLAVPTMVHDLVEAQKEHEFDLSSLRAFRSGGAPISPALVREARERICEQFYFIYGTTEAISNITVAPPYVHDVDAGSIGRATQNWEVRVVEPASETADVDPTATVGPGGIGELIARGRPMTRGYLDRPAAERELFVPAAGADDSGVETEREDFQGAWLRTGDIVRVAESGNLFTVDRIDNMIVSGGENIYPQEVEGVLEEFDPVEEAAVLGAPDDRWGQVAVAVVVAEDVTEDDLEAHCRDHDGLADYKRPRRYVVSGEPLPRSPLGKLRRGIIRENFV